MRSVAASSASPWHIPVSDMVHTDNEVRRLRELALSFLGRLREKPGVVGLGLLGGLAEGGMRHFADRFSDIDITVLLHCDIPEALLALPMPDFLARAQPLLPGWLPNFKFVDPRSGVELNVHQHVYEYESRPSVVWDNDKCSAYADTLEIIYDPWGHLRTLVTAKTSDRAQRSYEAALKLLARGHSLARDVTASLGRGRPDVARELIVRVAYEAIDVLLFLMGGWPPGPKWKLLAVETVLDRDRVLASWSYSRLIRLIQPEPATSTACGELQAEVLALLSDIRALAARTFTAAWPADVYGFATMRVFTDRQLRWDTAADKRTAPGTDYALRFMDAEWNQINHNLDDVPR